jgi:hypothetical protein
MLLDEPPDGGGGDGAAAARLALQAEHLAMCMHVYASALGGLV